MAKGTCSIDGCEKPIQSRGWCAAHYYRWYRYGDPEREPWARVTVDEAITLRGRFAPKDRVSAEVLSVCVWCSVEFTASRASKCCSASCYVALWRYENPERFRVAKTETNARRRAVRVAAPTYRITTRDLVRLANRQRGQCAYCPSAGPLTLEHVVPLVRGGSHGLGNIVLVCKKCNSSKGGKLLTEWRKVLSAKRSAPRVE